MRSRSSQVRRYAYTKVPSPPAKFPLWKENSLRWGASGGGNQISSSRIHVRTQQCWFLSFSMGWLRWLKVLGSRWLENVRNKVVSIERWAVPPLISPSSSQASDKLLRLRSTRKNSLPETPSASDINSSQPICCPRSPDNVKPCCLFSPVQDFSDAPWPTKNSIRQIANFLWSYNQNWQMFWNIVNINHFFCCIVKIIIRCFLN